MSAWLLTVPNNKESSKATYRAVSGHLEENGMCTTHAFDMPDLVVGTLDSLMYLSDDLIKMSLQVENVAKKIERQYMDISVEKDGALTVNESRVGSLLKRFQWDLTQFQYQGKPLVELVAQIQAISGKAEDELKSLSNSYTEKVQAVAAARRKKQINFATSDFEDFLKPAAVAKLDLQDSDTLLSLMVVVPKSAEQEFLANYSTIGSEIACFGGPDWTGSAKLGTADGRFGKAVKREKVRGSPVVPGSAVKVKEEGEQLLYTVTILRGHYQAGYYQDDTFVAGQQISYVEPVIAAFREKRYIVREFVYDSSRKGGVDAAIKESIKEVKTARAALLRWSKAHFGEVYSALLHLKIIQTFVESVLRYGLPTDFCTMFAVLDEPKEKELKVAAIRAITSLRPELRDRLQAAEEESTEDSDNTANLPFVCTKFPLIGLEAPTLSSRED